MSNYVSTNGKQVLCVSSLHDPKVVISPQKTKNALFEDEELEALLDEYPCQTQKDLAELLYVGVSTVSERLKAINAIGEHSIETMIHLTGYNFKSREIIQNIFSPLIGVICSEHADKTCHKNNLSFVELLQPFAKIPSEAHFRDVSDTSVSIRGLRLNFCDIEWRPPQTVLARKMLNESVFNANSEQTKLVKIGGIDLDLPHSEPWFENWRETFLTVQFPSDHEFTRHFLSCLIVLSSNEPNIIEAAHKLTHSVQEMQKKKLPKWFQPNEVLNSYVVLHEGDLSKAQQGYELLKSTFSDNKCFLIQINSLENSTGNEVPDYWTSFIRRTTKPDNQSTDLSGPKTPQDGVSIISMPTMQMSLLSDAETESGVSHPLSPSQEHATEAIDSKFSISSESLASQTINPNVWTNDIDIDAPHGSCLSSMDIENLRHFVQDYAVRSLIPYVERLVANLNEAVTNKKGVSKSLLSATKRWFVTRAPGVAVNNQNAVIYSHDSTELQTRKLGDLYFMFGHYNLAFQAYHQAKRDFQADSAWQYYAGALEMAAIAAFMLGTANKKTYDYMEDAIVCYLTVCKLQQFATRATLLSMECLKTARLYGDAAKQLIRMTSEESDLRSALLLEQASYCFLAMQPAQHRKYAFHIVLAGNRYSRAGQRKHAFRCYRQAYQVFENRHWSLAEDHIQYTMAKQACMLKRLDDASKAFAHLLRPESMQNTQQQNSFLKEYIQTQNELLKKSPEMGLLPHALPEVIDSSIRVLTISQSVKPQTVQQVLASQIDIKSDMTDELLWHRIEEMLVAKAFAGKLIVFKPTRNLFTKSYPAFENPIAVQGEPIEIAATLKNPISCSLTLKNIDLLWDLTLDNEEELSNSSLYDPANDASNKIAINAAIKSIVPTNLLLEEKASETLYFKLIPKLTGNIVIKGLVYEVASTVEPNVSLLGSLKFKTSTIRSIGKQPAKAIYDQKLSLKIIPTLPALNVSFSLIPSTLLAGEIIPVTITLRNLGIEAIDEIYLGCENPRWISLSDRDNKDIPLSILNTVKDLSNEKLVKDHEMRRQHVFRLLSKNKTNDEPSLEAQCGSTISMWIQAPFRSSNEFTLRLLFYYSFPSNSSSSNFMKYRIVRHFWKFNIQDSLHSSATCLVNNSLTKELGINLNLRNEFTPNVQQNTSELFINSLSLYSIESKLNTKTYYVINPMEKAEYHNDGECIKPQRSVSLQCRLENKILNDLNYTESACKKNEVYSLTKLIEDRLSTLDVAPSVKTIPQNVPLPLLNAPNSFLINHETIFFSHNLSTEDFNNIFSVKDPHMTLIINWSNLIINNQSDATSGNPNQRWAHGLHFIQLRHLYETSSCPTSLTNTKILLNDDKLYTNPNKRQVPIQDAVLWNKTKLLDNGTIIIDDDSCNTNNGSEENDEVLGDFWDEDETSNIKNISQRCLLQDESFIISAKS